MGKESSIQIFDADTDRARKVREMFVKYEGFNFQFINAGYLARKRQFNELVNKKTELCVVYRFNTYPSVQTLRRRLDTIKRGNCFVSLVDIENERDFTSTLREIVRKYIIWLTVLD